MTNTDEAPNHFQHATQRTMREERVQFPSRRDTTLRELSYQLEIRAERMRLLTRAEEGLYEGDLNPYTTVTFQTKDTKEVARKVEGHVGSGDQETTSKTPSKTPMSLARQRRRDKVMHTGKTKIDIKNYRPDYAWNKGGRLKELRIRCLARKFLKIWMQKLYGRLSPAVARSHFQKHLLKKVFRQWHELWWELRREWRLEIRAECHHRYVLWRKSFRVWKQYTVITKVKKSKLALAERHAAQRRIGLCFGAWLVYKDERHHKKQLWQMAESHFAQRCTRATWKVWCDRYALAQKRKDMEVVALQFWAYRIQAQHWLIWYDRLSQRKKVLHQQFVAVKHYNQTLIKASFRAWCMYISSRRERRKEKAYAFQLYHKTLVLRTFQHWTYHYSLRRSLAAHEENIKTLAQRFQKRRTFTHWKHFTILKAEEKESMTLAAAHYDRHLLSVGWSAFHLHLVQCRIKVIRHEMAQQHRNKQLIQRCWNQWIVKCEHKEELLLFSMTRKARQQYRVIAQRKAMTQLKEYCKWRQYRKAQYARADAFFYVHFLPTYFIHMKVFVNLMKQNRENAVRAVEFRRENTMARFFYIWVNNTELSKENRMYERMAILHHEANMQKSFFKVWKRKMQEVLEVKNKETLAEEYHDEALMKKYLLLWKNHVEETKTGQRHNIIAIRNYHRRIQVKCLQAWKRYALYCHIRKQKHEKALSHLRKKIYGKVLTEWIKHTKEIKARKALAEVKHQKKSKELQRHVFRMWRENIVEQREEKKKENNAKDHLNTNLLSKVFKSWHRFSATHAYKKSQTLQWVETSREHLQKKCLEMYFRKWKDTHSEAIILHIKEHKAKAHFAQVTYKNVLQAWKDFTKLSVKKKLLNGQCKWFHIVRLTAETFIRWKHFYAEALEMKKKTDLALWHWSLVLLKKVLVAWLDYVQDRKRKKERVTAALERRRQRLLRAGVTKWLVMANDVGEMRSKFAAHQQAKNAYESYQLVQRCALHWKHWTAKRIEQRSKWSTKTNNQGRLSVQIARQPRLPVIVKLQNFPPPVVSASPKKETIAKPMVAAEISKADIRARARPRKPAFLIDSLKREGLYKSLLEEDIHRFQSPKDKKNQKESVIERKTDLAEENLDLDISEQTPSNYSEPSLLKSTIDTNDLFGKPSSGRSDGHSSRDTEQFHQTFSGPEELDTSQRILTPSSQVSVTPRPRHTAHSTFSNIPVTGLPPEKFVRFSDEDVLEMDEALDTAHQERASNKLELLTPADFLYKKDGNPISFSTKNTSSSDAAAAFRGKENLAFGLQDIDRLLSPELNPLKFDDILHSRNWQQAKTTVPSVTLPDRTVKMDISQISFPPYSEDKVVGNSYPVVSFKESTGRGTISTGHRGSTTVQQEIISIRDTLKKFSEKKKRLKKLQKQKEQLCAWLQEQEAKDNTKPDDDVAVVRQELTELIEEIASLTETLEAEKSICEGLAQKVKNLVLQLPLSS
ncbi:hypothetical protein CHS0354_007839 [Potamilus streckersoni]|uniref:Protein SFI1 homolog n=1 Tax=Potamilus streckersoni TaxID=2493646 RepID=A0AAE0VWC7_9BIVA|nr:hypothetical protein CHS0354_007839 [Potamilus streckersoni]